MNDSSLRNAETRAQNLLASTLLGAVLLGSLPTHAAVIDATRGETRDDVGEALASVDVAPKELKLLRGLAKLALDGCRFEAEEGDDPVALRDELFAASAAARRSGTWERERLIATVAARPGLDRAQLQRPLFADLKDKLQVRREEKGNTVLVRFKN